MDVNLHPGDRFTVIGLDGKQHLDTVHSILYRSAQPEILKQPEGWRRILRNITPRRWRKPLPVLRPYEPTSTEIIGMSQVGRRAELTVADMNAKLKKLLG